MHILAHKAQRLGTIFGVILLTRGGSGSYRKCRPLCRPLLVAIVYKDEVMRNCERQFSVYGVDDIVIVVVMLRNNSRRI